MSTSLPSTPDALRNGPRASALAFAGRLLGWLHPRRVERLRNTFTLPVFGDGVQNDWIDRLIRRHLAREAGGDSRSLEGLHRRFWQEQQPDAWFRDSEQRHSGHQAPALVDVIERIQPLLASRGIRQACEFGPGAALWLDHLSRTWTGLERFIGIDIAQAQVDLNAERYPALEFVCGDLLEWARAEARPQSIFITHCGVFEYLSQGTLEDLYGTLVSRAPGSMLFIVEPFGRDFDLDAETASRPYGYEFSFSHNHPHLCRRAGMVLDIVEEREIRGDRQMVLVAHWP